MNVIRAGVATLALFLILASAASADVLVNAVPTHIACGKDIKVGIWYQSFSGGPRWARIKIKSHGFTVFRRSATAKASHWRYWHYTPDCGQTYTVVYRVPGGTVPFRVRVS